MTGESEALYIYVKGNSIGEKINYSYSNYEGLKFLNSWSLVRGSCVEKIDNHISNYTEKKESETTVFLKLFLKNPDIMKKRKSEIHLLLKRFEVTKRIYTHYNSSFRRANENTAFNDISCYIYFGLVLANFYEEHDHLQYLNSLIKLNDIICREVLNSETLSLPKSECLSLLKKELTFVKNLVKLKVDV